MFTPEQRILTLHMYGYAMVFLQACIASFLIVWAGQAIALMYDKYYDWNEIFTQLSLSLTLLAFLPGQTFWKYRVIDKQGRVYLIVGEERRKKK